MKNEVYKNINPWQELGVLPGSSEEQVKRAYRKLAMKFHPDRNPGKGAEESFKRAQYAYELCVRLIKNPSLEAETVFDQEDSAGSSTSGDFDTHPGWRGVPKNWVWDGVSGWSTSFFAYFIGRAYQESENFENLDACNWTAYSESLGKFGVLPSQVEHIEWLQAGFVRAVWLTKHPDVFVWAQQLQDRMPSDWARILNPWVVRLQSVKGGILFDPLSVMFEPSILGVSKEIEASFHEQVSPQLVQSMGPLERYQNTKEEPLGIQILEKKPRIFGIYINQGLLNLGSPLYKNWVSKQSRPDALALKILSSEVFARDIFDILLSLQGAKWLKWTLDSNFAMNEVTRDLLVDMLALFSIESGNLSHLPMRSGLYEWHKAWLKEKTHVSELVRGSWHDRALRMFNMHDAQSTEWLIADVFSKAWFEMDWLQVARVFPQIKARGINLGQWQLHKLTLCGGLLWRAIEDRVNRATLLEALALFAKDDPLVLYAKQGFGVPISEHLDLLGWSLPETI